MQDGSPITYIFFGVSIIAAWTVTLVALKNWRGNRYLCEDCTFNKDGDCLKVERPKAISCTAYRSEKQLDYRV